MKKQRSKSKFRRTGKWLKFRAFKKKEQGNKDAITLAPLHSGFQIHHIDQNEEKYEDLSKIENFVALNRYSHKLLHYLFTYYKKDKAVLERLKALLEKMLELNCPSEIQLQERVSKDDIHSEAQGMEQSDS